MPVPLPKFRHTVETSDNLVRVTLPSKKSILHVVGFCLWSLLWGYIVYGFVLIALAFRQAIEIGRTATPPTELGGFFVLLSIFVVLAFLVWLALGAFAIQRLIWVIAGKEVIQVTPQTLTISKQAWRWQKSEKYSSAKVRGLRTNTQPLSIFLPGKRVKRFLGGTGMIAFEYDGRTTSFGLGINEAEAEQIIHVLRQQFPQEKAG